MAWYEGDERAHVAPLPAQVVASLHAAAQVFMTSTELPEILAENAIAYRAFHVEQGQLRALL